MPKYENSVIYKIKHNEDYDDNNIYVGSTTNFRMRKNCHKVDCNNEKRKGYNTPVYQYIRNNGGWDNFVMIPIEPYPCNDKDELKIRERHHIDLLRPTLNKYIPTRTRKEYHEDNKEKLNEKSKKWYDNNKEKFNEYYKKRYEANKEKLNEYNKKYHEANKEIINERLKKKVICDHCGCEVRKDGLKKHQKSKKCINFVKTE